MIFPEKPVIWVNPQSISLHALPPGGYFAQQMQRHNPFDGVTTAPLGALWRRRLVYGGRWDLATMPVDQLRQYRWMQDLARQGSDFRSSKWYRKARSAIERDGSYCHKTHCARTCPELDTLFETEFLPLLESMRTTGYRVIPGDWPLGVIDRHGRVLKSEKGRHRFAAARVVGLDRFPLSISAIHRIWAGGDRGNTLLARVLDLGIEAR